MRKRSGRHNSWGRRLRRLVFWSLVFVLLAPVAMLFAYRYLDPPVTPLMLLRMTEGEGIKKTWVPLDGISPHVARAVISLEDSSFCEHAGIDWGEMFDALSSYYKGKRVRGASTISMQTTKNLLLWPQRNMARKAVEAPLTVLMEMMWDKQRILEVYLNIVEWGPGIYGIEAAARAHFNKPARWLNQREAALLAAVLPNPRKWSPSRPGPHVLQQVYTSKYRVQKLRTLTMFDCTRPQMAASRR